MRRFLILSVLAHGALLAGSAAVGTSRRPRSVEVPDHVVVQWQASRPAAPEPVVVPASVPAPPPALDLPPIEPLAEQDEAPADERAADPVEERVRDAAAFAVPPARDAVCELAARTFAGVVPEGPVAELSGPTRAAARELVRRFPRAAPNVVAAATAPATTPPAPAVVVAAAAEPAEAAFVDAVGDASRNRAPVYPDEARLVGVEGVVRVAISLDAAGVVTDVRVVRSSGHRALDRAAVRALRHWHFSPARRGGSAVPTVVEQSIVFRLVDDAH